MKPRKSPPRWAAVLNRTAWAALPAAPGKAGVPLNGAIDLHKSLTGPFVLALMATFDVWTAAAWTYLALHGSYGLAWVIKDRTFPNPQWRRKTTWSGVAAAWTFLSLYWVAPTLLVLGAAGVIGNDPVGPGWPVLAAAIAAYALGLTLMVGADIQKNLLLARRADGRDHAGLVDYGFFARTRHPNYLGEMLIYGSFALVAGHWLPWLILAAVWSLFFLPNMLAIDASVSRYPGYPEWEARTGLLLPKLGGPRPAEPPAR
jgi:steroid 5-alpha reductase family enzyme